MNLDLSDHAVVDSGCTMQTFPADNTKLDLNPIPVPLVTNYQLSNGNSMTQTHTSNLPIDDMPASAELIKVYADHAYKSLLSLGQLADAGYTCSGNNKVIHLQHPHHKLLYALRCLASNDIHIMSTKTDLAVCYHCAVYSPVSSTFIQSTKARFFAA